MGGFVGSVAGGALAGAATGALAGGISDGWEGALQGARFGAIGGAIAGGVGSFFPDAYNGSLNGAARYGWSPQRVIANSIAGGVTSELQGGRFADGFRASFTISALTYIAVSMRADTVDNSRLDPRNASKISNGFGGDGFGSAGSRFDAANPGAISPFGGCQGCKGYFGLIWNGRPVSGFGSFYSAGSWQDHLLEAYGGVHDYLNKPTWYDQSGNIRQGMSRSGQFFGNITNFTNLIVATPFVAASVVPTYTYSILGTSQ